MRLALAQIPPSAQQPERAIADIAAAAEAAAAGGADVLVAPEMVLSGYDIGAEASARLAEPVGGAYHQAIAGTARSHGLAIQFGYPERADEGVYNAVSLISAQGETLLNYRKTHLWSEIDRSQFLPGAVLSPVIDLHGVKTALAICYDIEFPELARTLTLSGAELILVSTATAGPYLSTPERVVPARAEENGIFVAYANLVGEENGSPYCGASCIVGPDGSDLARAGQEREVIMAPIDRGAIARRRAELPYLADRRPDLYRL